MSRGASKGGRDKEPESEKHPADIDGHEQEYAILDEIVANLPNATIKEKSYVHKQKRRIFIQVKPEKLRDVVLHMQEKYDMWQMSTLSGRDLGNNLQACYHFFLNEHKVAVTFKLDMPREDPQYPSISNIVPAAEIVENELREMFGIIPLGHPNPRPAQLPENWPANEYPLRKDWADPRGLAARSKTKSPKPKEGLHQ